MLLLSLWNIGGNENMRAPMFALFYCVMFIVVSAVFDFVLGADVSSGIKLTGRSCIAIIVFSICYDYSYGDKKVE